MKQNLSPTPPYQQSAMASCGSDRALATAAAGGACELLSYRGDRSRNRIVSPSTATSTGPMPSSKTNSFSPRRLASTAAVPTVGTGAVLADLRGDKEFVFEEGIGPVEVAVDGGTIRLRLRAPRYESSPDAPPAAAIASALSLPEDAIADCWYGGVGLRFCFIRLASPELVDRAALDRAAWASGVAGGWAREMYVFAGDFADGARLHARMFGPGVGVDEDPATGSACASLIASLAARSPEQDGSYRFQVDQGVAMGRPSALEGTASKEGGEITEVTVGGSATIVGHGTMTLPAG